MSLAGLPRSEVLQGAEVDVDPSGEAGGIPGGRGASGAGGRGGGIDDEAGVLLAFFVVGCRLAAFFAGALRAVFLAALLGAAFLAALLASWHRLSSLLRQPRRSRLPLECVNYTVIL